LTRWQILGLVLVSAGPSVLIGVVLGRFWEARDQAEEQRRAQRRIRDLANGGHFRA
jgi:hypothetical protein